jgi:hypothetical protein
VYQKNEKVYFLQRSIRIVVYECYLFFQFEMELATCFRGRAFVISLAEYSALQVGESSGCEVTCEIC